MAEATTKASFACKERLRFCCPQITFSLRLLLSLSAATSILVHASNANASQCNGVAMASRHGTPPMGCALVDDTVHDRGPLNYMAGFDVCSEKRSRGRIGHRAFLGDSRCVAHIHFEDGGKGKLGNRLRIPGSRSKGRRYLCGLSWCELQRQTAVAGWLY